MAARTIEAYYDNSCDSHGLFEPYAVAQTPLYETHINKYEVIGIDVLTFLQRGENPKTFIDRIVVAVLSDVREKWPNINHLNEMTLANALATVHEQTGARFIFVIDEWDAVIREANM